MQTGSLVNVVHTGLQTLLLMGVGWHVARRQWLHPAATADQAVSLINMLVMRVCLPALQLLLLAVHTDMRTLENWRLLGAFMIWTAAVQTGCGVWVLLFEGGRLDRWGLHALVLAANNTGILAPVVLDAALGKGTGYIGMLATVCLYFQQLPVSEALMAAGNDNSAATSTTHLMKNHKPGHTHITPTDGSTHGRLGQHDSLQTDSLQQRADMHYASQLYEVLENGGREGTFAASHDDGTAVLVDCHQSVIHAACDSQGMPAQHNEHASVGVGWNQSIANNAGRGSRVKLLSLLASNPLVWTTGVAAALSTLGSSELLLPNSPVAMHQLAFVSGSLEWLARCSVPLTLLSTGLWLHGRTHLMGGNNIHLVLSYLGLKLFVLPWLMLVITRMMGIDGHQALALLLLTVVPVGQTAFVISERYQCGTKAVTATLIAGLLLMLPHLLLVLWVVDWLGLYHMPT